jgi:2-polyprenyl-6-methoxyphenol hydroxylase-like FAD-dependent oxidoreductase
LPFEADVIVAGAGPVGLVAALSLAVAGMRVLVLEKRDGLSAASLASTIHPPTLQILDRLGVLRPVMHLGHRVDSIQHRTPEGVFAEFHMAALAGETPFPFRMHLEQARITPAILARLQAMPNAEIRFGWEVTGVEQTADRVVVSGPQPASAPYLLAADGARSAVRQSLGLDFDGAEYPDKILRVMTTDDLDVLLPGIAPVTYLYHGGRSVSFLRMPECWRIILRVPKETSDDEAMDHDWILSRFQAVLPSCERLPAVAGMDVCGASRRVASAFQQGRVILIGDAAHITSTRGGMNMNCGIHDASAVARALVTQDPAVISEAVQARHRVATEALIPRTDRSVSGGQAWMDVLRDTAADPAASTAYLRTAAMLDMLERAHA